MGVAEGVPSDMRDGSVDREGWVEWKVIDTTLNESELIELEKQLDCTFPEYLVEYLKSCCQLLDQVHSHKFNGQLIFMSCCPSDAPLKPFKDLLNGWQPLLESGYIPFAEWGDGWGPMCLDLESPSTEVSGDYNIVWFDHEEIIPLGKEGCSNRKNIIGFAKPLYDSFKEFFEDVYKSNA